MTKLLLNNIDKLKSVREETINNNWHYALNYKEKNRIIERLLPKVFNADNKEILFNFNHGGHKLLFLFLSQTIKIMNEEKYKELSYLDSVSRQKILLTNMFNRNKLDGVKETEKVLKDILENKLSEYKLIKKYVDNDNLNNSLDYEGIKKSIRSLQKQLNKYTKRTGKIKESDFNTIKNYHISLSNLLFNNPGKLLPASVFRHKSYIYCNEVLDKLFNNYNISNDNKVKYIYSLKRFDPSLRFLFTICKDDLLDNVKEYSTEEVHQNAK